MIANQGFLGETVRSVVVLVLMMLVLGLAYPLLMTGLGQVVFPKQVAGSLVYDSKGNVTGSILIGQAVTAAGDFWGRPSASGYSPLGSAGSNLGPTNPQLLKNIQAEITLLQKADPLQKDPVPVDLVTASGSGLDPDISVAAAEYQAHRVAVARHLSLTVVENLIADNIHPRVFGVWGEPYVNVMQLNQALDQVAS
jgi:K+-transporting ATPase ATPase C chain